MLRKDSLYVIDTGWEPEVPTVTVMQQQVEKRQACLSGRVRAAMGKFAGSKNEKLERNTNTAQLSRVKQCSN